MISNNEKNIGEQRINDIIDVAITKAMDKLLDNMKDTYEINMDNKVGMKSECLIMLDMMYCIFPEMKIFGQTVRDLLIGESDININILLVRLSEADFNKKVDKMRKQLEIHGYILSINEINDYVMGWKKFRDNYITLGMTCAYVTKMGMDKRIKILIISNEKMCDFSPIFRCDLLMMDINGVLSIRKNIIEELEDDKCMINSRIKWMRNIMNDINNKRVVLIEKIKIKNGYADRLYRAKVMYHSIKMLERGWQLIDYKLNDCGFNMELYNLKRKRIETLRFPNFQLKLMDNKNNFNDKMETQICSNDDINNEEILINKDICSICMESLNGLSVVVTKCGHYYHNICIFQHIHKIGYNSTICPICRTIIVCEKEKDNDVNENINEEINGMINGMINGEINEEINEEEIDEEVENNVVVRQSVMIDNSDEDTFDESSEDEMNEINGEYNEILVNAQL